MPRWPLLLAILALAPGKRALAADPTVGECVAASNASAQLRIDHKLRQAREQLRACVSASCPSVVRDVCIRRMEEVAAAVPSVVFEVKDSDGRELSAVRVTMDGEIVADRVDGSAVDLDPGEHRFLFEAPGKPPLTETILVHEGDKRRVEVAVISAPTPPVRAPSAATSGAPATQDGKGNGAAQRGHSWMLTTGRVTGAAGIAGLVVGGVFAGLTYHAWNLSDGECPSHAGCSRAALDHRSDALTFSTVSDVGFIAGGALAALGLTLILAAPRDAAPALSARVGPGWVGAVGRF